LADKQNKNISILTKEAAEPLVYVSSDNKAHFAYKISFYLLDKKTGLHKPTTIINAETLQAFKTWDDIKTQTSQKVESIGGNPILGKLFYDDKSEHLPSINMFVNNNECNFENDSVILKRGLFSDGVSHILDSYAFDINQLPLIKAPCHSINGKLKINLNEKNSFQGADGFNGGYSPASDVLYAVEKVEQLYQQWYGIPVFSDPDGKSKKINAVLHFASDENLEDNWNNAAFDSSSSTILIGDGDRNNYPNTNLDTIAHELGHGFTDQHSNLIYDSESGGINESFSDITAKAVEFMINGKSTWILDYGTHKDGSPLRYFDEPKKDNFSIGNVKDFNYKLDVHFTSGIFNKAFYHLATTPGWNTKKAFDVMVAANRYYWTANTCFEQAADGVISAGQLLNYNVDDIKHAFAQVGITGSTCSRNLVDIKIPFGIIRRIDKTPACPSTSIEAPLQHKQAPCHTNTNSQFYLPIEKESTELKFKNYLNSAVKISIEYFNFCQFKPIAMVQNLFVQGNQDNAISINTNCTNERVKPNNEYSTIRVMVSSTNENQQMLDLSLEY
jgi:pseudolysin